ncbi:F0F1 ATP synthase subunit delta [Lentisalinibacter sediminis]|uniref:F0F1 ATP synthase subunit delta n=1 Tax=Lentisalinibacter sediminis TaxID=2992237 RepID=UPI00386F191F
MADKHTLARPYADALFDLARQDGTLDDWSSALGVAATVAADDGVAGVMHDPRYSDTQRIEFLTGLFAEVPAAKMLAGGETKGTNLLRLLVDYDRIEVLPEIAGHFDELKAELENTIEVTVTAASPLTDELSARIRKALEEKLGREVTLSTAVDEELIGGAVIRAGDFVIDGSIRSRLTKLANVLGS